MSFALGLFCDRYSSTYGPKSEPGEVAASYLRHLGEGYFYAPIMAVLALRVVVKQYRGARRLQWNWGTAVFFSLALASLSSISDQLAMSGFGLDLSGDPLRGVILEGSQFEAVADDICDDFEQNDKATPFSFGFGPLLMSICQQLNVGSGKCVLAGTLAHVEKELESAEAKIDSAEADLESAAAELESTAAELESATAKLSSADKKNASLEVENMALTSEVEMLTEQLRGCLTSLETEEERTVAAAIQAALIELLAGVEIADDEEDDSGDSDFEMMGELDSGSESDNDYEDESSALPNFDHIRLLPRVDRQIPVKPDKPDKPKPETARRREGRALREALTEIYRLENKGLMNTADDKFAALESASKGTNQSGELVPTRALRSADGAETQDPSSGSSQNPSGSSEPAAGRAEMNPANDRRLDALAATRAREIKDMYFEVGNLELTRRVVKFVEEAPEMRRFQGRRERSKDAEFKQASFDAARAMFTEQTLLGSNGKRNTDDRNAFLAAAAALLPRDLHEKKLGGAAKRILGLQYRQQKAAVTIRANMEDSCKGWRRLLDKPHSDRIEGTFIDEWWHSDEASREDNSDKRSVKIECGVDPETGEQLCSMSSTISDHNFPPTKAHGRRSSNQV